MMSPPLPANQQGHADFPARATARLAPRHRRAMVALTGGECFVQSSIRPADHTPSPVGQRASVLASLSDFFVVGPRGNAVQIAGKTAEPAGGRGVPSTDNNIEGTGTCRSVQSFLRLARQSVLPPAARTSVSRRSAAVPSARASQPSQAGRSPKVPPSAPRPTWATASLTPASADLALSSALPRARAGRAGIPSTFTGTAQLRLARLFALPAFVKGTADV